MPKKFDMSIQEKYETELEDALCKVHGMDNYIFRGQPITGCHAYVLLGSIKRVQEEAPNPTAEEIKALEEIVADFNNKFEEDLRKAYPYPWKENEL